MNASITVLVGALILTSSAHSAPAVYKCVGPNGTVVFSQLPCGKDAKAVDTSGALRTGTSPNVEGVSDYAAMGRIDSDCRMRELEIDKQYQGELADVDRRIARLHAAMRTSMNNLAGATRNNGIQAEIASLNDSRSSILERERADRADLRSTCDERRAAERQRQVDRDAAKMSRPELPIEKQ